MKRGNLYYVNITRAEFLSGLAAAVMLHVIGLVIYIVFPKPELETMQVKTLNIRLGDPSEMFSRDGAGAPPPQERSATTVIPRPTTPETTPITVTPQPSDRKPEEVMKSLTDDSNSVSVVDEEALQRAFEKSLQEPHQPNPQTMPALQSLPSEALPSPVTDDTPGSRAIRNTHHPLDQAIGKGRMGKGERDGNSLAANAEILKKYEQTLALWIQGSHREWPDNLGMKGVVRVALRIDRKGNLRGHWVLKSSGNDLLDRLAMSMVDDANPMPVIPQDYYPGENIHQFEINITVRR